MEGASKEGPCFVHLSKLFASQCVDSTGGTNKAGDGSLSWLPRENSGATPFLLVPGTCPKPSNQRRALCHTEEVSHSGKVRENLGIGIQMRVHFTDFRVGKAFRCTLFFSKYRVSNKGVRWLNTRRLKSLHRATELVGGKARECLG